MSTVEKLLALESILEDVQKQPDSSAKDSLINYITSAIVRAASTKDSEKHLLLLVGAIAMLSASNSNTALQAARKLANIIPSKT